MTELDRLKKENEELKRKREELKIFIKKCSTGCTDLIERNQKELMMQSIAVSQEGHLAAYQNILKFINNQEK